MLQYVFSKTKHITLFTIIMALHCIGSLTKAYIVPVLGVIYGDIVVKAAASPPHSILQNVEDFLTVLRLMDAEERPIAGPTALDFSVFIFFSKSFHVVCGNKNMDQSSFTRLIMKQFTRCKRIMYRIFFNTQIYYIYRFLSRRTIME